MKPLSTLHFVDLRNAYRKATGKFANGY